MTDPISSTVKPYRRKSRHWASTHVMSHRLPGSTCCIMLSRSNSLLITIASFFMDNPNLVKKGLYSFESERVRSLSVSGDGMWIWKIGASMRKSLLCEGSIRHTVAATFNALWVAGTQVSILIISPVPSLRKAFNIKYSAAPQPHIQTAHVCAFTALISISGS
jgi:hypothetical protein